MKRTHAAPLLVAAFVLALGGFLAGCKKSDSKSVLTEAEVLNQIADEWGVGITVKQESRIDSAEGCGGGTRVGSSYNATMRFSNLYRIDTKIRGDMRWVESGNTGTVEITPSVETPDEPARIKVEGTRGSAGFGLDGKIQEGYKSMNGTGWYRKGGCRIGEIWIGRVEYSD